MGCSELDLDGWQHAPEYDGPLPAAAATACLMYTSGTTGPSKGVLMPHAHCYLFGLGSLEGLGITAADRYYVCMPLFHANGLSVQLYATLIAGASAVLRGRFQRHLLAVGRARARLHRHQPARRHVAVRHRPQPSTADDRDPLPARDLPEGNSLARAGYLDRAG